VKINLKRARENRLMTQEELSQKTGIPTATISRIETGKQEARITTVRKLMKALDVSLEELKAEEND
jgi:transcriptional regulator with XRE-family HTH domain